MKVAPGGFSKKTSAPLCVSRNAAEIVVPWLRGMIIAMAAAVAGVAHATPTILQQPTPVTAAKGSDATFTVVASGADALKYQWSSARWYNGAWIWDNYWPVSSDPTLVVHSVDSLWDNHLLRCWILDSSGSATSDEVALTVTGYVPGEPAVSGQPGNVAIPLGAERSLSVSVVGNFPLTFQWQILRPGSGAWANYAFPRTSGSTSDTLYVTGVLELDGSSFRCVVTNPQGQTTSAAASISIVDNFDGPPVIRGQPVDRTVVAEERFQLQVTADRVFRYQWRKNAVDIPGANSATYEPVSSQAGDAGTYDVAVSNRMGTVTSRAVEVAFVEKRGAVAISGTSVSAVIKADGSLWSEVRPWPMDSGNRVLARLAGTPAHQPAASLSGDVLALFGEDLKSVPPPPGAPVIIASEAIGMSVGKLSSVLVTRDGRLLRFGGGQSPQEIATDVYSATAESDEIYFIRNDATLWVMHGVPSAPTGPALVATNVRSVAVTQSAAAFVKRDDTLWFVGHNATGAFGSAIASGATTSVAVQLATAVRSVALSPFNASLQFIKTDGSLWAAGDNSHGQLGDGTTVNRVEPVQVAVGVAAVSCGNDHCLFLKDDGSVWTAGQFVVPPPGGTNAGDGIVPTPYPIVEGPVPLPQSPSGLTASSGQAGRIRLDWQPAVGAAYYEVWRAATNDPAAAAMIASRFLVPAYNDFPPATGVDYHYWVRGVNAGGASAAAGAAAGRAGSAQPLGAHVIGNPQSAHAMVGTPVTFSVTALGDEVLSYQWTRIPDDGSGEVALTDDLTYAGTRASALQIHAVKPAMQFDQYRCHVTNAYGSDLSTAAALQVDYPTTGPLLFYLPPVDCVAQNGNQAFFTTRVGGQPGTIAWEIQAPGSANWQPPSSAGLGAGFANLEFRASLALDGYRVRCVVSNSYGMVYSAAATLHVVVRDQDFDADGFSDILLENTGTGQRVLWLMGGADGGNVRQGLNLGLLDPQWRIVAGARFNADGSPDILLENTTTGQRVLWLMGGPDNAFVLQGLDLGFLDAAWHITGAADFNGDGAADILLENTTTGQRVLWLMGGANNAIVTEGLDLGALDPTWHIVGLAHFNADAAPDVLLENRTSGQRVLWLMGGPNNAYVMHALDLGVLDPAWRIANTADFNRDGAPDILLENTSSGQRVLWLMGGPNNAYVTQGLDLGVLPAEWHILK